MSVLHAAVLPSAVVDWRRVHEDLALLAELGVRRVRIGLDWARMQPRPATVDDDRTEQVLALAMVARAIGVELSLTLCDGSVPGWFDDEGGFADQRTAARWWPRWVEAAAERFGDVVGGWVPMDDPLSLADALFPRDPRRHGEVLDTLVVAWRDAWRILRGGPPVSTSLAVEVVRPVDGTELATDAARRLDHLRWNTWQRALRDGIVVIPGRADRELPDLAGAADRFGIVVRPPERPAGDAALRWRDDVPAMLHRTAEDGPGMPIGVTAVTAAPDDATRVRVVDAYLEAVDASRDELPIEAVCFAPALDSAASRNGIVTIDREVKDSGHAVAAWIAGLEA